MTLTFGDVSFADYNALVFPSDVLTTPVISYERVEVLGRNGDLFFSKDRYKNVILEYTVIIMNTFDEDYENLRAILASQVGYKKVQDSRLSNEYRMGYLTGDIIPVTMSNFKHGKFKLSLSCKPQRYLSSGDDWNEYTDMSAITITNPTLYPARPVLRIYGNGTVNAGSGYVTVTGNPNEYVDVDCETMNASYNGVNANQYIAFPTDIPPTIESGDQTITATGITKLEIMPRWWTL